MLTQQKTNTGFGSRLKRFLLKGTLYTAMIYGAGVAIDYHLTNDRMTKEHDALKTEQVKSLVNVEPIKYMQLEQKVVALEKEQSNILMSHSLIWPYSVGQSAYNLINKK